MTMQLDPDRWPKGHYSPNLWGTLQPGEQLPTSLQRRFVRTASLLNVAPRDKLVLCLPGVRWVSFPR
ncbi:hypothetical protein N7533_005070 [Penicillium manginii]|uniref:uncharacterized protein n=1 Tax=Penicillium manginii TaxID=203109 RepID=UPI002548C953|nr:uncharacterized protein N7533_005070 [Penicillium manginii]KAJ5755527.1 hypothetical protein N7533_005070 [Penicillium manginii]